MATATYTQHTHTLLPVCMQIWLEMEIGITGGEEDGVDNTGMDQNKLYTQPEQVRQHGIRTALTGVDW